MIEKLFIGTNLIPSNLFHVIKYIIFFIYIKPLRGFLVSVEFEIFIIKKCYFTKVHRCHLFYYFLTSPIYICIIEIIITHK